ncbi:hypothetical protein RIF29_07945 [Crotalaria pallida]|uniref:Calmodulin-binding domain-containing protein n=1 Tax=Crotalaria pallida TaxID=3830 RepID=A0AAN9J5J8_CROPI
MSEKIEPEEEDGDEKANPMEGLIIKKGPHKIASRYLTGPKGSCHDICKYGIEHAIEAKPWLRAKKRVATSTTRQRKIEVSEENVTCLAGNKKSGSSSNSSLISKNGNSSAPVVIKEVIHEKIVTSDKNSTPSEETDVSIELNNCDMRQAHSHPPSLSAQEGSKYQTKKEIVKNKCAFGSSSRKETAIESRSKQKRTSLTGGKEKSKPPSNPLYSTQNLKKPSSSRAKNAKNMIEVSSSLKSHKNVEKAKPEEPESNENLPVKILHVIEPINSNLCEEPTQARDATKFPSLPPSSSGDKSLKQTIKKTSKSGVSAASSSKGLRHGTRSNVSHLSSEDKGKRNMLHKTGSASRTPSVRSSLSSSNSSLGRQSAASAKLSKTGLKTGSASRSPSVLSSISLSITSRGKQNVATSSKSKKAGHSSQGESVKVGYKIRPKLSTKFGAANKVVPAWKLTFRRGRVIELPPESNSIPRRLKFRPVRLLGDDFQKDINGARKRIISSKEGDNSESNAVNIKPEKAVHKHLTVEGSKRRIIVRKVSGDRSKIDGSKLGSEKVVLRHRDVEGKKVNPRLYNNVIEETASKLAELRKSKVKALVGAFETVISLDSPRAEVTAAEVSTHC